MAMLSIFKSRLARITYIYKDGSHAVFAPRQGSSVGWYMTKDPNKIAELKGLHEEGHPHIYIDPKEYEIDEKLADPAVAMREQIATEERARIINLLGDPNQLRGAGIDPEALSKLMGLQRDFGETGAKAGLEGIGNSTSTAATAAESNAPVVTPVGASANIKIQRAS
jgi:hypothetical protein